MKERPIKLDVWEVRAILRGRKTQTRPELRPQPPSTVVRVRGPYPFEARIDGDDAQGHAVWFANASCKAGDRLYVREALRVEEAGGVRAWSYQADGTPLDLRSPAACQWAAGRTKSVPSHAMPRWASRLTLVVADVRIVRLQEIGNEDALAEGVEGESADPPFYYVPWLGPVAATAVGVEEPGGNHAARSFERLCALHYGPGTWERNPFVAAIAFRLADTKADAPTEKAA